ncbi:MAG: ComEC/Rec2 family competence protein, partial [Acidobacteriota bacterium]
PLNALAIAAASGVVVSPLAAFDGGFLLSFGAALGILLGAPRLRPPRPASDRRSLATAAARSAVNPAVVSGPGGAFRDSHRWARRRWITLPGSTAAAVWATCQLSRVARGLASAMAGLFVATVCAEIALAPLGAALFSRITFAGLILNFAAIPLMAIAQTGAMATLAAAPVAGWAARGCGYVTHLAASGIVRSAGLVDLAPWLSRDVPPPAWWLVAAYYASCIVMLALPRLVRVGVCGLAVSAAVMLAGAPATSRMGMPRRAPGTLRVVFLDVGQGDATVAILPDGRALLVDAGGLAGSAFDIGDRIVGPSLRALGVRRLETLVLTHGDPDHVGGAPAALRAFAPRAIWEGVPVPPHAGLRELHELAMHATLSWRTVQAGDREAVGAVETRVLHPPPPAWERQRVRNDDSVVIELRMGVVSFVLPGDIELEGERLAATRLDLGAVAIVKAPHHGSATSSSSGFIAAAHPSAVVFSAGRGNRFGHPAPAVVARYRGADASIFRTDQDGAIVMDTDGSTVQITTWSGRRMMLPR